MNAATTIHIKDSVDEIRFIQLTDLFISPENVRVVSTTKEDDKKLLASLKTQGLLQNLVVIESSEKLGKFEVIAGGRRFAALTILNQQGDIPDTYQVFCKVKARSVATAVSLSENIKASMHPADEFLAYQKLSDQGKSEKQIASEFGTSTNNVKKLLKLASVAPDLIAQFRDGKMSLECVMAFSVTENHEKQLSCWKDLNRSNMYPHAIRTYLLKESISDDDEEVKFVGLKTYRQAGGAVSTDLFQNKSYCLDMKLLSELVQEKLNAEASTLAQEGWKWIETSKEGHRVSHSLIKLQAEYDKVPKKLLSELAEIEVKLKELEELDGDDWNDQHQDQFDQLDQRRDELLIEKENFRAFTKEQKSQSGCIVTFNYEGKLLILRGLVKKEDLDKTRSSSNTGGELEAPEQTNCESSALIMDLKTYHAQSAQAELLNHPDLAYDLMVFSMACSILNVEGLNRSILDLSIRPQHFQAININETKAAKLIDDYETQVNTSWAAYESQGDQFIAFRALSIEDKTKIMTFCIARCMSASPNKESSSLSKTITHSMNFSMNEYWVATYENYFSRVKRDQLLQIGQETICEDFLAINEKAKKGDLARLLDESTTTKGWLPDLFR